MSARLVSSAAELFYGFYPIYGFVACVLLVLTAKVMRLVLKRDESYYGASETYDTSGIPIDYGGGAAPPELPESDDEGASHV